MLDVLDSLRRLLDSPQRIVSHVRLDSTHGTSRTAMPADERKRRCAAAEKARRVRGCARPFLPLRPPLRRTSRWLMSSSVCSLRQRRTRRPSHHHYYQHCAAQQQLEQQRQQEWLSAFGRKWGFQRLDRAAADRPRAKALAVPLASRRGSKSARQQKNSTDLDLALNAKPDRPNSGCCLSLLSTVPEIKYDASGRKPAQTRQKKNLDFLGGRVDRSTITSHRQTPRSTNAP